MSTRILLILGFSLATLHAADPAPEDLLRQGLFEEEANQNFDKAAEHYRAVIAAHERERALAASATFRLGEIARKKNDKEAAAAAFRTVTESFSEQQELARLSRENLAALGIETTAPAKPASASASTDPEDTEIARLKELARNSPDLIDGAGTDGWRPIHHAAAKGWTRVISYLLENKADSNARTSTDDKITPLHLAAIHGHLSAVKTLLAGKADSNLTFDIKNIFHDRYPPAGIKSPNVEGPWTALDLALLYNRRETALALIQAGSDVLRKGPLISGGFRGANSLQLAIYFQRNDLAQTMIDAAKPGSATVRGDLPLTPLVIAIVHNPAMVAPLIKAGADVKETIVEGATALHWAPNAEMAEFLISKGADPNAKNTSGLSPLDCVVQRVEAGKNAELIENLLKHGATVSDPRALLRRTSEAMLPFVGERLVYPKLHKPDAILLSVSGDHSFNQEPTPIPGLPGTRVFGGYPQESRPEVIALETRASPESPPPSLAEVMRMAFGQSGHPRSIRIIRRGEDDRIDSIRKWGEYGGNSLPTDWPALEWGDIVEVRNSSAGNTLGDLAALIPARAVTYRLGGLEFPKTFSGNEIFWLQSESSQTFPSPLPLSIKLMTDLNRYVIHRKGLAEPITLDFSKPTDARFRLLDGDTVEMSWDVPKLYQKFNDEQMNHVLALTKDGGGSGTCFPQSLVALLSGSSFTSSVDFSKVCILRRAENWKPEMFDLKAWLERLPPREKWERDALVSSAPKLNPGDAVIVIENSAADAEKTAAEVRKKAGEVGVLMSNRNPRPRVEPPSMPTQPVSPAPR